MTRCRHRPQALCSGRRSAPERPQDQSDLFDQREGALKRQHPKQRLKYGFSKTPVRGKIEVFFFLSYYQSCVSNHEATKGLAEGQYDTQKKQKPLFKKKRIHFLNETAAEYNLQVQLQCFT